MCNVLVWQDLVSNVRDFPILSFLKATTTLIFDLISIVP